MTTVEAARGGAEGVGQVEALMGLPLTNFAWCSPLSCRHNIPSSPLCDVCDFMRSVVKELLSLSNLRGSLAAP